MPKSQAPRHPKQATPAALELKPPSVQAVNIVLAQAANCPLQNVRHSQEVMKALGEVEQFFQALYGQEPTAAPAAPAEAPPIPPEK